MAKVRDIFSALALSEHLTKACLKQQVCYDKDKTAHNPEEQWDCIYCFNLCRQ